MTDSSPLTDVHTEGALLGVMLWNPTRISEVCDMLEVPAFSAARHQHIYSAMLSVHNGGGTPDVVTVRRRLEEDGTLDIAGGKEYLAELVEKSPTSVNPAEYAGILAEVYLRRRLHRAGVEISEISADVTKDREMIVNESENALFAITQSEADVEYRSVADILPPLVEEIEMIVKNPRRTRGLPTGYAGLDDALSGLHASDLIVLAARPSVGKTTLALDIAYRASRPDGEVPGTPVGIFSLEMSAKQLTERMIAADSGIDSWRLRTGALSEPELEELTHAKRRLTEHPVYIDDRSGISTLHLRSAARRMKREGGINLLIVDYLQLITPQNSRNAESHVHHITEVSRTLKQIARELNIPVLALSQLSRDVEKRSGEPRLSDLRDSGSIEQDADVVLFLHRDTAKMYEGDETSDIPVKMIIGKHRKGRLGLVRLEFNRNTGQFREVDSSE